MTYELTWEGLLTYLDGWATAREVSGGIEVELGDPCGGRRVVEMVVTPEDWDVYVTTVFGTGDAALTPLKEKLLATPENNRFLVYATYDWVPSPTRTLVRPAPPTELGEWVVRDERSRVTARYADQRTKQ